MVLLHLLAVVVLLVTVHSNTFRTTAVSLHSLWFCCGKMRLTKYIFLFQQIALLKENQSKAAALNAILNEQLQDTEKKYQQVVTEMQFLILEREKNLVLMKCKDQDIQDMRKNLE